MRLLMRLFSWIILLLTFTTVSPLKFDLPAHRGHESASKERCIRNFVAKDTLVVVTATVSGTRGDGQLVNMHVRPSERNGTDVRSLTMAT